MSSKGGINFFFTCSRGGGCEMFCAYVKCGCIIHHATFTL